MSDETTLLPCPFCGGEAVLDKVDEGADYRPWFWYTVHCSNRDCVCADLCHEYETEAEAIAAWNTRAAKPCYATDYTHDGCKYSMNRGWTEDTKFYIPTVRHGTLTAEQVRHASHGHYKLRMVRDVDGFDVPQVTFDWQAIADELNELGSGMCNWHAVHIEGRLEGYACECGNMLPEVPRFCPNCGRKVVSA